MRHRLFTLLCASLTSAALGGASQVPPDTAAQLRKLAAVTHFATDDIVKNRWSESGRWPVGLLEEQQHVVEQLRSASRDRRALRNLLTDADPKVRTLALGALFMREDPQDLPLIARLMGDTSATIPRLGRSPVWEGDCRFRCSSLPRRWEVSHAK
jgi:hypothetical protein